MSMQELSLMGCVLSGKCQPLNCVASIPRYPHQTRLRLVGPKISPSQQIKYVILFALYQIVSCTVILLLCCSGRFEVVKDFSCIPAFIGTTCRLTECLCFLYLQCLHGPKCKMGSSCTIGRRVQQVNILGGLILPVWGTVEKALSKQVRTPLLISHFYKSCHIVQQYSKQIVGACSEGLLSSNVPDHYQRQFVYCFWL